MTEEKPPLGVKPRWLATQHRAAEVLAAIRRFNAAKMPVPKEWREEVKELNKWLFDHSYSQVE